MPVLAVGSVARQDGRKEREMQAEREDTRAKGVECKLHSAMHNISTFRQMKKVIGPI